MVSKNKLKCMLANIELKYPNIVGFYCSCDIHKKNYAEHKKILRFVQ